MTTTHTRLSAAEARDLVARIQQAMENVNALIIDAHRGQAHLALDYPSFADFAAAVIPKLQREPEERKAAAQEMKEAGMSTRSTAAALGVSQPTVIRDLSSPASESSDSTAGETSRARPRRPRTAKPVTGGKTRKLVEEYAALAAAHPTWRTKEFQSYLGISHQEARRRSLYATAPEEIRQALYDGKISVAVVETLLDSRGGKLPYIRDVDRVNVVNKIIAGLAPSGAAPLRQVMETLADPDKMTFALRDRWLDADQAMSYEELWLAIHDDSAERAAEAAADRERAAKQREITRNFDQLLKGSKFLKWIPEVRFNLDVLRPHLPEIIASARYRNLMGDDTMESLLLAVATEFTEAAEEAAMLERMADERAAGVVRPGLHVVPTTVVTDEDGTETISGTVY